LLIERIKGVAFQGEESRGLKLAKERACQSLGGLLLLVAPKFSPFPNKLTVAKKASIN